VIDESVPTGETDDEPEGKQSRGGVSGFLRETAIVVGLSLIIATVVRIFFVQAFLIPSPSMEETLQNGDRVLVSKISMRFDDVHRGDVVVFKDPGGWLTPKLSSSGGIGQTFRDAFEFFGVLPDDSEGHLIKRVIGVGGDEVVCCDDEGRVTVNGQPLDESDYLFPGVEPSATEFEVVVPEGDLFVMGDNRANSGDSRINGPFDEDLVVGRAFAVAWPISRWDGLSRPSEFDSIPDAE
jgi:signal peptidase I